MSKEKINRRKAAGDVDPTMSQSNATCWCSSAYPWRPSGSREHDEQPNGWPVDGRWGMAQPGSLEGGAQSPYGDPVFAPDVFTKVGTPGYAPNSDRNQNIVEGRGLNAAYGSIQQPLRESQDMMEPMHLLQKLQAVQKKCMAKVSPFISSWSSRNDGL